MVTLEQPDISINPKNHKVMAWLSPSFPLGSFAYSHGLEFEISEGNISTSEDLFEWLEDILRFGSAWNELVLFCNSSESILLFSEPFFWLTPWNHHKKQKTNKED